MTTAQVPDPESIPNWMNLPVQVGVEDVVSIQLTEEETDSIAEYSETYLNKAGADSFPSQWNSSKGAWKRNPNTTGIKGEYAGVKYFAPEFADLPVFLSERPWRMSDMGDAIIMGKKPKIFDYKTRTRKASLTEMLESPIADEFCAEMDAKFGNREKYGYLHAFIFCINDEPRRMIHLVGWMGADEFFSMADLIPRGNPIPQFWRTYDTDEYMLPYRRLHPIAQLKGLEYASISEKMTLAMKEEWFNRRSPKLDLKKYLAMATEL